MPAPGSLGYDAIAGQLLGTASTDFYPITSLLGVAMRAGAQPLLAVSAGFFLRNAQEALEKAGKGLSRRD